MWIKVTDRLPEPSIRVLINCDRDLNGLLYECDSHGFTFKTVVSGYSRGNLPSYVTHWMPLPEPPTAEQCGTPAEQQATRPAVHAESSMGEDVYFSSAHPA